MNKLNIFFDQIKRISFLGRIFKWSSLRSLSYEALQELTSLNNSHSKMNDELNDVKSEKSLLEQKVTTLKEQEADFNVSIIIDRMKIKQKQLIEADIKDWKN